MDEPRHRAVLMRRARVLGRLATVAVMSAAAAPSARGQTSDLTRTVDAEARVAMFQLATGDSFGALSRLERINALSAQDSARVGAPERAALHFLLAQSYYRLGMLAPFRREAEAALAAGPTRYAAVLRPQLMVEAYRNGDYSRAASLARDLPASDASGLGPLVAGLAAYQSGDFAGARTAFGRASTGTGQIPTYARYMSVLTQLRGDTAQIGSAVASLEAIAGAAAGEFADQVRLTAAQVAYEAERYGDAERLSTTIRETSQVAAPALLTRAWALYKLDRVEDAERAFSDFATKYPGRPERGEAQLMAAQAQLELGRSTDAERVFQRIADSTAVDVSALQAQTNAAIADVSRALVADRAADLLIVGDPAGVKALAVRDSAAAGAALAAVADSPSPITTGDVAIIATSAGTRLDSLANRAPASVKRVLFAPASATGQQRLAERSQNLAAADAAVTVARYRLGEQLEAQQREIALLGRMSQSLAGDSAAIGRLGADYQTLADSMARLDQLMAAAERRLRGMLSQEIEATRALAAENGRTADSLRAAIGTGADPEDRAAIDAEVATAASYARIADLAASGLDNAIAHHPAFVARDSLRAHNASARALLAGLQGSYSGSRQGIAAALVALRGGDGPAVRSARQALTDAEARRSSAEGEMIAAVSAELSARAGEMVAGLQRNTEAAQFGIASAAFFRAIDNTRAVGGAGSAGSSRTPAPERRR
jgi:tetratricopeptide (TPR) repeat protein